MNRTTAPLLALALLLAPIVAALPNGSNLTQPLWASIICILIMLAVIATARAADDGGAQSWGKSAPATLAFAIFVGLCLLSIPARLLTQHSLANLGMMLPALATLATQFALFLLCRRLARTSRAATYAILLGAVVGSGLLAANGMSQYALDVAAHQFGARVFSWSTPDFLAGYLAMLLPITLALFLGAPAAKRLPVLLGLFIALQLATLLTTGSRFALVSIFIAIVIFAFALVHATRHGMAIEKTTRRRITAIIVIVVVAGLAAARPVLQRLTSTTQGNSAAFRLWTWRGAARMAAANPVFGTGIGAWANTYPKYALTGFTRLAHNSYLQTADECGLPALIALLATLGAVGIVGWKRLKMPLVEAAALPAELLAHSRKAPLKKGEHAAVVPSQPTLALSDIAPADDRLLLCGLLGGLAAEVVQNLIDSDWHVFFIGITFWAAAGLVVGLAERGGDTGKAILRSRHWRTAATSLAAIGAIYFATQSIGFWFGYQAQAAPDPVSSAHYYTQAQAWDPLNGRYPAELGARVYSRTGNLVAAEDVLRLAVKLEPTATNFNRLGLALDLAGKREKAMAAYQTGLQFDPNSLDLLLGLAKDSPPAAAQLVYKRITELEDSPVGKVRAIGEINEARFAIADSAIADAAMAASNKDEAIHYYQRAKAVLEEYVDQDGTMNIERQALMGNQPNPDADKAYRDLYAHVLKSLSAISPLSARPALDREALEYQLRYQAVIAAGYSSLGDSSPPSLESAAEYHNAASAIDLYLSEVGGGKAVPNPSRAAQMRDLYKHVMDALIAQAPTAAQAALRDREQQGLRKFDQLPSAH